MLTLDQVNELIADQYPLTEMQYKFVLSYADIPNGMKAVRDAGFSHSTPGSQSSAAYRLLKLNKIRKALELVKQHSTNE